VENKDEATNVDGEWVKTIMRKMIYGDVDPRIEHPSLAKKANVKSYSKSDMAHMMLEVKYVSPLLPNPETYYMLHHFQICLRVGVELPVLGSHITKKQFLAMWDAGGFGIKRISSLQHNMLLHSIPSAKRIWSVRILGGLFGALCPKVLL
jgi:hypothetical protein